MDIFTIVLYALGAIVFVCGIVSIIAHLRYQERSQRLPEACKYLDLAQRNESLHADNANLKKENDELAAIHEEAIAKKKWLEANRDIVLSLEEDRKKQEEIKASYEGYLDKLSGLIPEVQEKSKEHEKLSGQILSAQEIVQEKNAAIRGLDERLAEMRTERAELEARNASLIKENETQAVENETAVRKLRELQDSVGAEADKLANISAEYTEKNKEYDKLSGQILSAQEIVQEKNAAIRGLDERLAEMRTERAELEAKNASLMKENETHVIENETAIRKLRELQDSVGAEADKLANISAEFDEKNKEYEAIEGKINLAKETIQEKTNSIEKLDEQLNEMRNEKAELESKNASLTKENESLSCENEATAHKLRELQDSVGTETDKLSNISAEYTEKSKQFAILEGKINLAQETIQEKIVSVEKLDEQLVAMRTEKADLEARNASLKKENETQVVENEAAVRKLRELQDSVGAEADKLAVISAEYTEKKTDLDSYQTRKDALLKEIDILKDTIETIKKETGTQTTTSEEVLKDLWEPIVFPRLSPPKKVKSELDLLANTKEYIRGKKLYFPDRVIHAFHTSLKCNDISPITVLAGISGTGKSELPKCYAEGMGIHFSMLAVQPRWDSPQDLLGFYNYMENKYKATELARALVRFDRYNRENWGAIPKACDDRSDRMLLVLLDEMNLARVEYYFSEFLSKLETRRGVDPDDEKDRVKAEIELELTGRAPLRIYADRNILFTGTMNEDESTQTLSDKVLDRANVLRFGKPKSTNIAEKVRNSNPRSPRSEGLTYECWHEWCVDAKDVKMDEQVSEWINRLNNAMEELQKPFGHRVAQAIVAYIENYPKGVANGKEKELAFADQIEQRIMPKLRGIDLELNEEPLKKIGELIEETGDKTLYDAYRKGSSQDNTNGVFLWQGIDRSEDF